MSQGLFRPSSKSSIDLFDIPAEISPGETSQGSHTQVEEEPPIKEPSSEEDEEESIPEYEYEEYPISEDEDPSITYYGFDPKKFGFDTDAEFEPIPIHDPPTDAEYEAIRRVCEEKWGIKVIEYVPQWYNDEPPHNDEAPHNDELPHNDEAPHNDELPHKDEGPLPGKYCDICGGEHWLSGCSYWRSFPRNGHLINHRAFKVVCVSCGRRVVDFDEGCPSRYCLPGMPMRVVSKCSFAPYTPGSGGVIFLPPRHPLPLLEECRARSTTTN